jgi:hypothetical protein
MMTLTAFFFAHAGKTQMLSPRNNLTARQISATKHKGERPARQKQPRKKEAEGEK